MALAQLHQVVLQEERILALVQRVVLWFRIHGSAAKVHVHQFNLSEGDKGEDVGGKSEKSRQVVD